MANFFTFSILISLSLCLLLNIEFAEIDVGLLLVDEFRLIFLELALDDLLYQVNGYIHVCALLFRTDNVALHRMVTSIFWRSLVTLRVMMASVSWLKLSLQFSDLLNNCFPKSRRNIQYFFR